MVLSYMSSYALMIWIIHFVLCDAKKYTMVNVARNVHII